MEILEFKTKELNDRIINVLNYIKDNPNSDPNAYEMNDIMFKVSNLLSKEKTEKSEELMNNFEKMMYLRLPQFTSEKTELGATKLKDYFVMQLANVNLGVDLGDEDMRNYMNEVCGVNLFIHQRIRDIKDDSIVYDNKEEHDRIFLKREMYDDHGLSNELMDEIDFAYQATPETFHYRVANFYKTR